MRADPPRPLLTVCCAASQALAGYVAKPQGVQKGSAEAVTIMFYVNLATSLRLGQLGGCLGRVCAAGEGEGGSCARAFVLAPRPLSSCDVHMCQVRVILLFFRVLAYF